jgi:hypothetical protein
MYLAASPLFMLWKTHNDATSHLASYNNGFPVPLCLNWVTLQQYYFPVLFLSEQLKPLYLLMANGENQ